MATTEIYTLSLHDALPIFRDQDHKWLFGAVRLPGILESDEAAVLLGVPTHSIDRKSTRLNSSHQIISYAVFCLKKKQLSLTAALSPYAQLRPFANFLPPVP